MILKEQLEKQGTVFFRWRGILPLVIIPAVIAAACSSPTFADGHAGPWSRVYDFACIVLSFMGLGLRGYTVALAAPRTSGRNTREQRADSLNVSGIYSVVRNPLYLANFLVILGMLLFIKEWWLVVLVSLAYVLYYERIIMAEERFLLAKFGDDYAIWANRTPVIVPNLLLWTPPTRTFSFRKVLRQEYNGFYLIVSCFYLLEWCDRILFRHGPISGMTIGEAPGLYWTVFFAGGTIVFLALRSVKKFTSLLDTRG